MSRALQQARLALHSVAAYSHRPMESGDSEDEALEMERMWRELRDDARKKVFRQHLTMRIDLAARECAERLWAPGRFGPISRVAGRQGLFKVSALFLLRLSHPHRQ